MTRARGVMIRASTFYLGLLVLAGAIASAVASPTPLPAAPSIASLLAWWVHASRTMIVVTGTVVVAALALGLTLGALAGMGPRLADALLSRAVEISGVMPTVILVAVVQAAAGPSLLTFIAVLSAVKGLEMARLVRGHVLAAWTRDYVVAARALGLSRGQVFRHHVLPHVLGPAAVSAAFVGASTAGLEAALGFLGLGLPPEIPSWGRLLGEVTRGAPTAGLLLAALNIMLTVGALYVIADRVDNAVGLGQRHL